ncbi:hypothetical protein EVAR_84193_1 [Eumeta japonica]|uniref:Uncharacterized protein n=1 Tax=Eumeta variegata TaxID=151549 RepID=A0A4C1S7N7_EUMVA|nr:hypothetical protein EVAR_84193_1 [Eumeta japonica]
MREFAGTPDKINSVSPRRTAKFGFKGVKPKAGKPCLATDAVPASVSALSPEDWAFFENVQYILDLIGARSTANPSANLFSASLGVTLLPLVQARRPDHLLAYDSG